MKFDKLAANKAKVRPKTVLSKEMKEECLDYIHERKNKNSLDRMTPYLTDALAEKVFDYLVSLRMTETREGTLSFSKNGKRESIAWVSDFDPYNQGNNPYYDNDRQAESLFHEVYCEAEFVGRIITKRCEYGDETVTIGRNKIKAIHEELLKESA